MRKLVYYVAVTIDGYIARVDGSIDGFPAQGEHVTAYMASLAEFDTVLMGRATYEFGYQFGLQPGEAPYPGKTNYVISRTLPDFEQTQVGIVREQAAEFVHALKQQDGRAIYLCGGGHLAGFLLDHQLIDELVLKLNPVIFGRGIRLFGTSTKFVDLQLIGIKQYKTGVAFHSYRLAY